MKVNPSPSMKGPINGANLTADTRNLPWHRPPEITDFNMGVQRMMKDIDEDRETQLLYSLLELEVPVYIITTNLLLRKIGRGIIPIDLAILMAGPVARYIEIIARDNGLVPDMDVESDEEPITPTMLKLQMGTEEEIRELLSDGISAEDLESDDPVEDADEEPSMGLMGPVGDMVASKEEQDSMLGEPAADEEELI